MKRTFTGRHMLAICIAFFGTIVTVNMVMAVQASRTFGGTVVDNSYVASQHFNRWLDEAEAERDLGWKAEAQRSGDRLLLTLAGPHGPLADARVAAVAQHPLGLQEDIPLRFEALGGGRFRSAGALPAGRWRVRLDIRNENGRVRLIEDLPA